MLKTENYDFYLPEDLIAQVPASKRDHSKLFRVDRATGDFSHGRFHELPSLLRPGDLLVVNNTRVVPARIFGRKETGGKVEVLVLEHGDHVGNPHDARLCLIRSSRRPRRGSQLFFDRDVFGEVTEILDRGLVKIRFSEGRIDALMAEKGHVPLPPYIKRPKAVDLKALDRERYQTVYAAKDGAVAAPTAGLHFTENVMAKLRSMGVEMVSITLHVGYGTFRPVETEDIHQHQLGREHFVIEPDTADRIHRTKANGGRVVAVGTTVVRTLETVWRAHRKIQAGAGDTELLITPGFRFQVVDALITNFHLPKSSLLFLVAAFAGFDLIKKAYAQAIERRYRFYSYGDAMLIV